MPRWLVQDQVDSGGRTGLTTEENAEIKRLRAENKKLHCFKIECIGTEVFHDGFVGPYLPGLLAPTDLHPQLYRNGFRRLSKSRS